MSEEPESGSHGAWVILAILILVGVVASIYFISRWSDGTLFTDDEEYGDHWYTEVND